MSDDAAMAKEQFLRAYDEASVAQDHLEQVHNAEFSLLEECIQKIDRKSERNKKVQTGTSGVGVGLAVATVASGGAFLAALPFVAATKWASNARYHQKIKKHHNNAVTIFEEDHQARLKFIEALQRVQEAHGVLLQHYPQLDKLDYKGIVMALKYPGVMQEIGKEAAFQTAYYMVMNHPETTANLCITTLELTYCFIANTVGPEAAMAAAEASFEMIPLVGLAINVTKYYLAKKDEGRTSKEADKIREVYEESKQHYEKLLPHMEQFRK